MDYFEHTSFGRKTAEYRLEKESFFRGIIVRDGYGPNILVCTDIENEGDGFAVIDMMTGERLGGRKGVKPALNLAEKWVGLLKKRNETT